MVQISIDRLSKLEAAKVNSNVQNFAYSFRPIYCISRVFGLFPYTFHDKSGAIQRPRTKFSDIFWLIISLGIYIRFGLNCFRYIYFPKKHDDTYVLILSGYAIVSLTLIFGAIIIVVDMCNRFIFVNIFQKINTFDEMVKKDFV